MLDPNKAVEQMQSEFSAGFQAGAASRDAEVARLKSVPMKYRRMAFNAQLQNENAQLHEQVALLRSTMQVFAKLYFKEAIEALAATEPKT